MMRWRCCGPCRRPRRCPDRRRPLIRRHHLTTDAEASRPLGQPADPADECADLHSGVRHDDDQLHPHHHSVRHPVSSGSAVDAFQPDPHRLARLTLFIMALVFEHQQRCAAALSERAAPQQALEAADVPCVSSCWRRPGDRLEPFVSWPLPIRPPEDALHILVPAFVTRSQDRLPDRP